MIVIGDTVRDVTAANAFGARCLGVATGSTEVSVLGEAGAELAVESLETPEAVAWLCGQSCATRS